MPEDKLLRVLVDLGGAAESGRVNHAEVMEGLFNGTGRPMDMLRVGRLRTLLRLDGRRWPGGCTSAGGADRGEDPAGCADLRGCLSDHVGGARAGYTGLPVGSQDLVDAELRGDGVR